MHNRKGFTTIELLIVLVIAGFILSIVLFAVPALQRQGRNTSRIKDAVVLLTSVRDEQTQSSTGSLPDSCDNTQTGCFLRNVGLARYDAKSTTEKAVVYIRHTTPFDGSGTLDPNDENSEDRVVLHTYTICNGNSPTGQYASPQSVAVQFAIETIRGPVLQCKDI